MFSPAERGGTEQGLDLFLHRKFCRFPCVKAAGEIPDVGKAFPLQQACRQTRAVSGRAINQQRTLAVEFAQAFLQMREKNMLRARDATILPFSRPADIEQLQTIS